MLTLAQQNTGSSAGLVPSKRALVPSRTFLEEGGIIILLGSLKAHR
jgi:hypothetical protein